MLWNKNYETGNTQVDNEHKEIFKLVQNVIDTTYDATDEKTETSIDFLAEYTVNHFKNEENLMSESSYPDMPIHKKQHDDFVGEVVALRERVKGESDNLKRNADIKKIIVNWLTDHVLGSDKVMANYYRKWSSQ